MNKSVKYLLIYFFLAFLIGSMLTSCGSKSERLEKNVVFNCLADSVHTNHYPLSTLQKSYLAKFELSSSHNMLAEYNGATCKNKQILYFKHIFGNRKAN